MKKFGVKHSLKVGDNTAIVIEDKGMDLKSGIIILDDAGKPHNVLSVGIGGELAGTTDLLLEGDFQSRNIYVEEVLQDQSVDQHFSRLTQVIARLRAEDGCPWDREQTHASLKAACVEEAAEVVCGINILEQTGNADNLKEELGDLLLQVVMHAQIAKEEGLFTMEDVIDGITEKMIRRHPHVFGTKAVSGSNEVLVNWAEIKKQEKAGKEWMESYLPDAFQEAGELIETAKKRKGF